MTWLIQEIPILKSLLIKKIEKKGKIVLLIGKGLFKKKIVIPFENNP